MDIKINKKSFIKSFVMFLFFLLLIFSYVFLYLTVKNISSEVESARKQAIIFEKKQKDFSIIQKSLEEYKDSIEVLENVFLSEEKFVDLLRVLENFASSSDAIFEARGAELPSKSEIGAKVSFRINGTPKNIYRFLILLDNSQYYGVVTRFLFNRQKDGSDLFSADMDYRIFNYNL